MRFYTYGDARDAEWISNLEMKEPRRCYEKLTSRVYSVPGVDVGGEEKVNHTTDASEIALAE